ncbi:hypothetical protein NGM10_07870 [Halorussus salilacus]|uniref:hypothetical protein n=1 Tax=Halorussus salilacus TaxID=2953750 RepID=UPI0020A095D1|nr:hypothetical protein [Halorussus salilacus]USZ66663.1 hypothetical protein NGM10_07870 [Halorussus salilacus]
MTRRTALLALATGLSAFLVVGVAVTELLSARIWPSLLVGIPVGIAAGLAGAAFVYGGLVPESPRPRRRFAVAAAGFGVAFLAVLPVAALGLGVRNTVALVLAGGVGAVVALAAYARPSVVESRVG